MIAKKSTRRKLILILLNSAFLFTLIAFCWLIWKYQNRPKTCFNKPFFTDLPTGNYNAPKATIQPEEARLWIPDSLVVEEWIRENSAGKLAWEKGIQQHAIYKIYEKNRLCVSQEGLPFLEPWKVEILTFDSFENALKRFNEMGHSFERINKYAQINEFGRHEGFFIVGKQIFKIQGHCHQTGKLSFLLNKIFHTVSSLPLPFPGTYATQFCEDPNLSYCRDAWHTTSTEPGYTPPAPQDAVPMPKINPLPDTLDFEKDILSVFEEELDIEKTYVNFYNTKPWIKNFGVTSEKRYFLSEKLYPSRTPYEGETFHGWTITIQTYPDGQTARKKFEGQVNVYGEESTVKPEDHPLELYKILAQNQIYTFDGDCMFEWFPRLGYRKLAHFIDSENGPEAGTVIFGRCPKWESSRNQRSGAEKHEGDNYYVPE